MSATSPINGLMRPGTGNVPAPARLTVGLISAGRVGTALGEALERADHVVGMATAPSDAARDRVVRRLPETQIADPAAVAARCELLILAVPDSELSSLIEQLVPHVRPGTIVVHTAGAHGTAILEPLGEVIALAIHPAMTFVGTEQDTERLRNACFGITARDDVGYAVAHALVLEMGGEAVRIREDARPLYHAALAHGSNHLVALVCDAVAALRSAIANDEGDGQEPVTAKPGGLPERLIGPLVTAALENTLRTGVDALTGPVARGDADAVATHLQVLGECDPGIAESYRSLSARAATLSNAPSAVHDVLKGAR